MTRAGLGLLLVDDEQQVLDALSRTLRGSFDVATAISGSDGLAALAAHPDIAIVVSDMRMPAMNGATFLARARALAPDTVRILLTGQSDLEDAMSAINEGNIFRFLRKPCPAAVMASALAAASEQHRLVAAERELLEQTLRGSVQALADTLALANPELFGVATRVRRLSARLATILDVKPAWQLDIAATVCELGAVNIPAEVLARRARSESLTAAERTMLESVPTLSERLIAQIPRLEGVREIVRYSRTDFDAAGPLPLTGARMPAGARALRVALEFEERITTSGSPLAALGKMRLEAARFDAAALDALAQICEQDDVPSIEVPIAALRDGMIVAAEIRTRRGALLVARGHEVTGGLRVRLENFAAELASPTVRVDTPRPVAAR